MSATLEPERVEPRERTLRQSVEFAFVALAALAFAWFLISSIRDAEISRTLSGAAADAAALRVTIASLEAQITNLTALHTAPKEKSMGEPMSDWGFTKVPLNGAADMQLKSVVCWSLTANVVMALGCLAAWAQANNTTAVDKAILKALKKQKKQECKNE